MKRLVLIDGHAVLYRAYHALPVFTNRGGQQTNAVYGFVTMLLKVVWELSPTHLAVCFDLPAPTFRQEKYVAYQAQRKPMDEELKSQIELTQEVLKSAGIPVYTKEGFEADDVLATLARQALKGPGRRAKGKGIAEVVIVTGDRDIMQLVNDKVKVYAPILGLSQARMFGEKEVEEYLGVAPNEIVDYKALAGDSSDNYPGVFGIGPKIAVELIKKYGSLENIYKALGTRQWALGESIASKLEKGREGAQLSQDLARIRTDAPVKLDLDVAKTPDFAKNEKFVSKLTELGFRSIVKRLTGNSNQSKSKIERNPPAGGGQMELV